jgi:hypothetical protein
MTLTGNLANIVDRNGELVVDTNQIEACEELGGDTWTASYRGWYRCHAVGTGTTEAAAIADLKRRCEV